MIMNSKTYFLTFLASNCFLALTPILLQTLFMHFIQIPSFCKTITPSLKSHHQSSMMSTELILVKNKVKIQCKLSEEKVNNTLT